MLIIKKPTVKYKKIKYQLLTLSVLIFSGISNVSGQTSAPPPIIGVGTELIGPSPDAMAFAKYGIIPVSLYTGVPDISIDLGVVEGKEISVPISLSYHNNGLKSYEKASSVGLGWSLNGGGVITRIIRDKIDQLTPTQYKYDQNINNYSASENVNLDAVQDFMEGAMDRGTYDTEPDIYVYNFGKYSGSFLFFNNKIYQFPYRKLKISGTLSGPFTITTEDGAVYTFANIETTQPKNSSTSSYSIPQYVSSWYLSTIQPADKKETINFSYSSPTAIIMHGASSQTYLLNNIGSNNILYPKTSSLPSTVTAIHLTGISTSKMSVSFSQQSIARTDIDGTDYALDAVSFNNSDGLSLKNFKFNYGYFNAGNRLASPLKLTSVIEDYNNTNKTHSFQYNETGNFVVLQDAVDHWGYVNNSGSPSIIIPNSVLPNGGANREPNDAYSSMGMLTKITYPTGGETRFTYEPNVYFNGKNYVRTLATSGGSLIRPNASDNTQLTNYYTLNIPYQQDVTVSYARTPKEATSTDPNAPNGPNAFTKDVAPEIEIVPVDGTPGVAHNFSVSTNAGNPGTVQTVNLLPGAYMVNVICDSKELNVLGLVNYYEQSTVPVEGAKGPGLRIKSIASYANNPTQTTPVLTKEYRYTDDSGFSTGNLIKGVDYGGNYYYTITTIHNGTQDLNTYQVYNSSIHSTLSDLLDQEMYYKQVYEKQTSPTDTLQSSSKFTSYLNSYDYMRTGVKLSEKVNYKKSSTGYSPVSREQYNYGLQVDTLLMGVKPYQVGQVNIDPGAAGPTRQKTYGWQWYSIYPSGWQYDISKIETTYTNLDSLSLHTYYNNDFAKTHNLLSVNQETSKGYSQIIKYKYPESYGSGVMQPLIDQHVLSPVIEQQKWIKRSATDSSLTSGTITEYDNTLFKPKNQYLLEVTGSSVSPDGELKNADGSYASLLSDSRYKNEMSYTYDTTTGNLVSQDKLGRTDFKQVNYLWGYSNNYPIAKCLNGATGDFFYSSFEDGGGSVITGAAHTGTQYINGDYNLSFSVPNTAKSYQYSYWYLQNGSWNFSGELSYTGPVTLSLGDGIDDVRVYPSDSQMTTYTYLPGVGITSMTDTKSQTSYYEYDNSKRLKTVKDKNGSIVKSYEYHNAGQSTGTAVQ
ncbi:hypothetical protein [Pedobacter sp. L105]|uniref:hypothetical protein n=1 Tax=Pedobacter sp. L105 TaxID=1641871 RepID=UPI00131E1857|nr:hypothetical protein [Pedobacter sp. L105]